MAESDSYAGNFHILHDNEKGGPALRRGYQIWKHETKDFFIFAGRSHKWLLTEKRYFDYDSDRNRDIDCIRDLTLNAVLSI